MPISPFLPNQIYSPIFIRIVLIQLYILLFYYLAKNPSLGFYWFWDEGQTLDCDL